MSTEIPSFPISNSIHLLVPDRSDLEIEQLAKRAQEAMAFKGFNITITPCIGGICVEEDWDGKAGSTRPLFELIYPTT